MTAMKKWFIFSCFLFLFIRPLGAESIAPIKVLFLGDSLTEGYGVSKDKSYPEIVKKILLKKGVAIEVLNGSVSGSTTASSESRLKWFLKAKPAILFLAVGANDGLRGIKVEESQKNLRECIQKAKSANLKVILAGMMVPPNYGPDYSKKFRKMYSDVASEESVTLMPFLLENVAGEKSLNQEDGIHPNELGHVKMAENVSKYLLKAMSHSK